MTRPLYGNKHRDRRIVFYTDEDVSQELKKLAEEANRTVSDYCHLLLVEHVLAVAEEFYEEIEKERLAQAKLTTI
jgi:hypothetical protein